MTREEFDALDLCELLDFVEAVVIEPAVNMGSSVDEVLDGMLKRIMEANAEALFAAGRGEDVFDTPAWRRAAERMEALYPPSITEGQLLGTEEFIDEEPDDDLEANMPDFDDNVTLPHTDTDTTP